MSPRWSYYFYKSAYHRKNGLAYVYSRSFFLFYFYLFIYKLLASNPFQLPFPCSLSSSCCFQKLQNNATTFSSPSRLANHLLSTCGCHFIPSFSKSRTSFFLCFLYFRHRVYRCLAVCFVAPHHQISGVSITPILTRKVLTVPCPTLSW